MYQGYLERGFAAGPRDREPLTALLGHSPRTYEGFAGEIAAYWHSREEAAQWYSTTGR